MAWFKVDDSMPFNTKTLMCSLEAIGLWVLAGAWASQQLTNGQVPKQVLPALRANEDVAAELVQAGLWIEDKENSKYYFHDWEKYNPTSEEVLDLRAKRAEAGRKGGIASAVAKRQASAKQTPKQNESNVQPRPVPSLYCVRRDNELTEESLDLHAKNMETKRRSRNQGHGSGAQAHFPCRTIQKRCSIER